MNPDMQTLADNDDDGAIPGATAPQQGLPDVGDAPEAAQDSVGTGMSKLGQQIGNDVSQGWENVKQSAPVRAVSGLVNRASEASQADTAKTNPKIVSYLMGADAAHPDTLDQIGKQVDPEGRMPPADRNLIALDRIRDTKGDNAAWQIMQANRVAYNAQTAFGQTALRGTQQKPADLNAAIDAANKAQANVLDGSNIQFAHARGGVTATVTMPGTSEPQHIALSTQAFEKFLDVGGDGQWDKIMDQSAPATLQRLSKQFPPQAVAAAPAKPAYDAASRAARPAAPAAPAAAETPPQKSTFGSTPSALDLSGEENVRSPSEPDTGIDPQLEAKANRLFPSISQGAERNRFIAAEQSRTEELENKIDVAGETGKRRLDVARETGRGRVEAADVLGQHRENAAGKFSQARVEAAKIKAQQDSLREDRIDARSAAANEARNRSAMLNTGQFDKLSPALQAQLRGDNVTAQPQRQAAPSTQVNSAPSAQDQQALLWARANPNDPRASKIMQKLGAQ